ncbi:photosynthetic complex putative assembly protein PuhB [Cognatishimia sp. F0-27]|uniref:photosynthetic complex putative assembly protein PuhB n=1 Tax=Cognatishimia sp. F0-27 TaxID=2816855 RepID=UPI001D0C70D3|nr:photosynthetic complex putative assembly protein PuhB [Cognatishimia sp. F0-27]MCC1492404.1 PH domain-containing protein [Cognatishimia sp. F0-27]
MSHDDFATEPMPGLPELPPEGERILWQGKPDWWQLAWESLSLKWVIAYFVFLTVWRFIAVYDLMPFQQAIGASVPFLILCGIVVAVLMLVAWVQAYTTVYTVTNKRVAMRVGAALTVTLNLPYTQIANASLALRKNGTGTIALQLMDRSPLGYAMCWPHIKPWSIRDVQPALRCIPEAEKIAGIIAEAAEARVSMPQVARASTVQSGETGAGQRGTTTVAAE